MPTCAFPSKFCKMSQDIPSYEKSLLQNIKTSCKWACVDWVPSSSCKQSWSWNDCNNLNYLEQCEDFMADVGWTGSSCDSKFSQNCFSDRIEECKLKYACPETCNFPCPTTTTTVASTATPTEMPSYNPTLERALVASLDKIWNFVAAAQFAHKYKNLLKLLKLAVYFTDQPNSFTPGHKPVMARTW